ncbi:MAG: tetratricopeptide repeat protein [bacterium]
MNESTSSELLEARASEEKAYREKDFDALSRALVSQADLVPDAREKAGLLFRAAVAAERAGDPDTAVSLYQRVGDYPVWGPLSRSRLFEIHWKRGEWQELVNVLDTELEKGSIWDERTLRLEQARLQALRLGSFDEAHAGLERLLAEDPDCREALWLNLVLYLREGDWEKVEESYARFFEKAEAEGDTGMVRAAALRLGQIREFRFKSPGKAKEWYQAVEGAPLLSRGPLFEMEESAGNWAEAGDHLQNLLEAIQSREGQSAAGLEMLSARIKADLEGNVEEARQRISAFLEREPENVSGLFLAAEWAMEGGSANERADLASRLMAVLSDPREISFFAFERVRLLLEDIGDYEAAVEACREWMDKVPEDLSAPHWLIEALRRSGRDGEALEVMDRLLSATEDQRVRQALLFTKAELATYKLADQESALQAYRSALEIPPSQLPVLVSMNRIYHLNGDYQNLARFLSAIIKLVQDPAIQKFYRNWLANIYLERLNREDQAFALYGEIVKSDPSDRTALKTIARVSARKGSWNNVAGSLSRILQSTEDPHVQSHVRAGLAWTQEVRLEQKDQAAALYKELADASDPFGVESLRRIYYRDSDFPAYAGVMALLAEDAQGPLRSARLVRLACAHEISGEFADAWSAYEKARVGLADGPYLCLPMIDLAQLTGYWSRYLGLTEEFGKSLAGTSRKALLWEAAWGRGEFSGPDGQVDAAAMQRSFQSLLEEDGGGRDAMHGLVLACLWSGDHRTRADVLARLLSEMSDEQESTVRLQLAYLLRDDLGAEEESIAALRQVLAKDQQNAPLLRELQLLYQERQQWGELIRMLLTEIPLRKDKGVLVDIYVRLAGLYEEKYQAQDEAIKCHQAVLRMVPDRAESHREVIRLLEARGRWEDMVNALHAFEAATPEVEEKISLLVRMANVLDEKLSDPDRAIAQLKRALELDPSRPDLLSELERIYEREGRYQELVRVLESQAEKVEENSTKATLHERIASIQEEQLADQDAAINHLTAARDFDPSRTSVLNSLERLFTEAERWEELIDTLERLASLEEDRDARIEYYSRIGSLWDEKLSNLEESIKSWERVREISENHVPALEALVSLYERTGEDRLFVDRSASLAELVSDEKARAVDLLLKAGSVLEERLDNEDHALDLYGRAMEIDSSALEPVHAARAVYERREDFPQVVNLLFREEQIVEETSAKLELLTRAGNIYEENLADEDSAAGSYERALSLQGDYLPAAEPLSEIYYKNESWDKARPLFEIRTGALEGKESAYAAEVWYKSGWCAEKTGETDPAMSRYHSSVEQIEYRPSLERLSEIYTQRENWEEAAAFTDRLLTVVREEQDEEAAFSLFHRKGHIEDRRGRTAEAAAAYEKALEIKPGDYETLKVLIDAYLRTEQWQKSLGAYDQLIRSAPSKPLAAEGLAGKGVVLEDHIKEERSALAHFQKAVEIAPDHLTAWTRLAGIHFRQQSWPEAEKAYQELLNLEQDREKLIDHHYHLGRVYMEGMSDLGRAREQFESALRLNEVHVPSMQALLDIYLEQEEWQQFIETSEKFVRLVPEEDQSSLAPTYRKMGQVYRDHTDNNERAVLHFQKAIKMNPDDREARSELASLYLSDPKFIDQAKQENRTLLRMDPFRGQTYRDLATIYKSQQNYDAMFNLYGYLNAFGELDYEEEMFYEANLAKVKMQSRKSLPQMEREGQLVHPEEKGPLRDMLIAMGDYLIKVFPIKPEHFGAKKAHRLSADSQSPVKDLASEIAVNLGLEDLDIYLVPENKAPAVIYTAPPSLIANAEWFNRFDEKEQRFIMGKLLENAANKHSIVYQNPPEKVLRTLCLLAMAVNADLDLELPGVSADEVEKQKKALRKLVPRKGRTDVEHAAERFSQETANVDPEKWKKVLEHTDNRGGLLVCGDPFKAFDAIIKSDSRYQKEKYTELEDKKALWEKNEDIIELLEFSVSDPYFRLRSRMGFAIA